MKNKKALLEASLFMANEPVSLQSLTKLLRCEADKVLELIKEMKKEFEQADHGVHLIKTPQGYQIKVKPEYAQFVRHLTPYQDLSRGFLRVLALVAYQQPITQSQIVKVIGNRAYEYIRALESRGLIKTAKQSRTKALFVTKGFANYFGLESTEDIKKFFNEMIGEKIETKKSEENEDRAE